MAILSLNFNFNFNFNSFQFIILIFSQIDSYLFNLPLILS